MRVLFYCDTIWPHIGGVEVLAHDFLLEMSARGYEFVVITNQDADSFPQEDPLGSLRVVRLPFRKAVEERNPLATMRLREQVARIKEEFQPELIHVFSVGPCTLFHELTRRVAPAPSILTAHTHYERITEGSALFRSLEEADWVTACSADVLEHTLLGAPSLADKSSAILNGLKVPEFAPRPLPGNQRILCIARLVEEKGFDVTLESLALLRKRFPGIRLTIAGNGLYRDALEQRANDLGVADLVDFLGWVQPEDVPQLMSEHDVVSMPSHREPFGLVALQAALAERPIVAASTGGLPEIVIDGETGLLADPFDAEANAAAIARLLDDPALATRLGKAANVHVQKTFAWRPFVDAYESLYVRIAAGEAS